MKILIIDNYDSFTFNLYQYVGEILEEKMQQFSVDVFRNDKITVEKIKQDKYDKIILSPGPGNPADKAYFGVCSEILIDIGKTIPVLGVCLGMQGMAHYFGGKVMKAQKPMHGKTSNITHDGKGIFTNIPQQIQVMRYHSLVADSKSLPDCLEISAIVTSLLNPEQERIGEVIDHEAQIFDQTQVLSRAERTESGRGEVEIMGLRHKQFPIEGIQFHPESFATDAGKIMLQNFLFRLHT